MGHHYGQNITYGVLGAPALFTGDKMTFSYREQQTGDDLEDGGSDFTAMAIHSKKGELEFEGEVTSGSTDFLDLSPGPRITVAGSPGGINLTSGFILAYNAVEEWNLLRRKTASVRAYHYPEGEIQGGDQGENAGALSAFTPTQALDCLFPGNTLIYSTQGFTHASGLVHQVRVTQEWQITDDDPSPDGKLLGAFASGYKRTLSLLLLGKPKNAAIPATRSVLTLEGAPAHMQNYRVLSAQPRLTRKKGMMFQIEAAWIPGFGDGGGGGEEE